jgi:hypothetical protein
MLSVAIQTPKDTYSFALLTHCVSLFRPPGLSNWWRLLDAVCVATPPMTTTGCTGVTTLVAAVADSVPVVAAAAAC